VIIYPRRLPRRTNRQQLTLALVIGLGLGVILGCLVVAGLTVQQIRLAALPPSPTPAQTATPAPTITLAPPRTAAAGVPGSFAASTPTFKSTPRLIAPHFLVGRPVTPDVAMSVPDPVYLYGTTEQRTYEVHHGEDFENPIGTPLFAVADGTIVAAGSDDQPICGDNGQVVCGTTIEPGGYYGNLVVIQLTQSYQGQRVFALYGHMSQIAVSFGDRVKQGDPIGQIGMSGVAIGPHIHFEIRIGTDDYAHTRNPILWTKPLAGHGSLVGRYTDSQGKPIAGALVDIYRADNTFVHETETYSRDQWPPVNSDEYLGENFAMGDLPAGDYLVRIFGQQFQQQVTIVDGKLTFVELGGQ
jgi:murein DD-endopeptidase MepM/ murein hydrolase activator NlpD